MNVEYDLEDLPPETVTENGKEWEREEFDRDSYQWVRPMEDEEYDWHPKEDDVSLAGTEVPIRVVSVQLRDGEWHVEASETAGPEYHRPGFTELIGSEYLKSTKDSEEAFDTASEFIRRLS